MVTTNSSNTTPDNCHGRGHENLEDLVLSHLTEIGHSECPEIVLNLFCTGHDKICNGAESEVAAGFKLCVFAMLMIGDALLTKESFDERYDPSTVQVIPTSRKTDKLEHLLCQREALFRSSQPHLAASIVDLHLILKPNDVELTERLQRYRGKYNPSNPSAT